MVFDNEKVIVEDIKENAEESDTSVEETHAKKKLRKYYICLAENCTAAFSRPYQLRCHMRKHTGERPFVCLYDECFKSYTRASHLKRHVQKVHEPKDEAPLICSFPKCEKKLKSQKTLDEHIKNIHEKRKYVCKTCSKPFRKHQHLKTHEYEHTGIKPFQCSSCDKSFLLPSKLKRHMKIHAGYKCDAFGCNSTFPTWTFLLQHRKASHPTTYSCDICRKIFNTRYNLQLHIKIHEEERQTYHCPHPDCPRYYLDTRNLLLHIKSYHEEREFHCTINGCKARFAHKVSLKKHLELHSNKMLQTKSKRQKPSKSNQGKKPKRRRKRKSSADKDMAAFLSGYNKNAVENITEDTCHHFDQHNVDNIAKENDLSEDQNPFLNRLSEDQNIKDRSINIDCH